MAAPLQVALTLLIAVCYLAGDADRLMRRFWYGER
jgi:hypothetical protein